MGKKKKPDVRRKPDDYLGAAENALELAKVLAGRGAISDQDFLERMAQRRSGGARRRDMRSMPLLGSQCPGRS